MNTQDCNEVKLFSAQAMSAEWNKCLVGSSRSKRDAEIRRTQYQKVFSRYHDLKEQYKMFSGYTELPLLSNQYFNATMASYVRSFAGFVSIERDMDQPTALLYYQDTLGVTDNRIVLPNIGAENFAGINARFATTAPLIVATQGYSVSTGKKIIPGSVQLTLVHAANPSAPILITDDRKGNLLAPAGILTVGTVNYTGAGAVAFTIGAGFTIATGDSFSLIGFEDVAGTPGFNGTTPGNNRFKMDMKNIALTAEPDMLIAESNLMAMAAMQKAIGVNPMDVAAAKLTELYTKLVNQKLVKAIIGASQGNATAFDVTGDITKFLDYRSRLDSFCGRLVDVDTDLVKKSVKGVNATAYIVGETMGAYFRKLKATGNFTDNTESTYINDLIGYYNGVPVLRHMDVGALDGYAIHKTADGQLAPTMRGIFLPLTNTPTVGNYSNPTQVANGIFYQESNQAIVPELIQKFSINAGA